MTNENFKPGAYKTTQIKGTEAAQHRAMFAELNEHWPNLKASSEGLKFVQKAPKFVAIVGAAFVISGAISALAKLYGVAP